VKCSIPRRSPASTATSKRFRKTRSEPIEHDLDTALSAARTASANWQETKGCNAPIAL
jgi:hypothetical protein